MADPFEQVVEAMARRHASCLGLRFEDADDEDREVASVMLQTAVAHPAFTGLLKLVEERPTQCCCCGDPAPKRNPDPWEGRLDGYCEDCAHTRCDAYPGECGKPKAGDLLQRDSAKTEKSGHQPEGEPSVQQVEAAAKEAFWEDDIGGHIKGKWTWDTIPGEGRQNYRKMVRAALRAALAIDHPQDREAK